MKFIFGLGNPGMKYSKTRHNIGFMALDCLAKTYGVRFKSAPKLSSKIALTVIGDETAVLVKPTTYMNNSGYAVSAVLDYYGGSADDRRKADAEWLANAMICIDDRYNWYNPLRYILRWKAPKYYEALRAMGVWAWKGGGGT